MNHLKYRLLCLVCCVALLVGGSGCALGKSFEENVIPSRPTQPVQTSSTDDPSTKPVNQTAALPDKAEWFSDAVMIGNSRMRGLVLYSGLAFAASYAYDGYTAASLCYTPCVERSDGTLMTVPNAIRTGKKAGKYYILVGVNESSGKDIGGFEQAYNTLLDAITLANPQAEIFLIGEFGITRNKEADSNLSQENIKLFNRVTKAIAGDGGYGYIDLFTYFAEDGGYLSPKRTSDGLHMDRDACEEALDYIFVCSAHD